MSAEPVTTTTNTPDQIQKALAAILRAARRVVEAVKELPNTSREWPGG